MTTSTHTKETHALSADQDDLDIDQNDYQPKSRLDIPWLMIVILAAMAGVVVAWMSYNTATINGVVTDMKTMQAKVHKVEEATAEITTISTQLADLAQAVLTNSTSINSVAQGLNKETEKTKKAFNTVEKKIATIRATAVKQAVAASKKYTDNQAKKTVVTATPIGQVDSAKTTTQTNITSPQINDCGANLANGEVCVDLSFADKDFVTIPYLGHANK